MSKNSAIILINSSCLLLAVANLTLWATQNLFNAERFGSHVAAGLQSPEVFRVRTFGTNPHQTYTRYEEGDATHNPYRLIQVWSARTGQIVHYNAIEDSNESRRDPKSQAAAL